MSGSKLLKNQKMGDLVCATLGPSNFPGQFGLEEARMICKTLFALSVLGSLCVVGCGGSGSGMGGPTPTPPPTASVTSVAVSCASATVNVGQTSQCSATVQGTGSYSSSVNWAVNSVAGGNATVGTVSTTGLYTAPATVPTPFTVALTATSVTDTTKSASSPVIVAGKIASVSQTISASAGGTITLPDGSSVTIAPGILSSDQSVTLAEVSYLPKQPPNPAVTGVGTGLVLTFSTPIQSNTAKNSNTSMSNGLRTMGTNSTSGSQAAIQFSINNANNNSPSLNGSVLASDIQDSFGVNHFIGIGGNYDSTQAITTGSIGAGQWAALTQDVNGVVSITISSVNFIFGTGQQIINVLLYSSPHDLVLTNGKWTTLVPSTLVQSTCPTGKTLLVVHGMLSNTESSFLPATMQKIMSAGGYSSAIGFDYDWTEDINISGTYLSQFINEVAKNCSDLSLDIEAHSEGVPVTMSALDLLYNPGANSQSLQAIKNVVFLGGPIMGTPIAGSNELMATYFMNSDLPAFSSGLAQSTLSDILNLKFAKQLQVSVPGSNDTLDLIRRVLASAQKLPPIFVVAGNAPQTSTLTEDLVSLSKSVYPDMAYSDGVIPLESALALQPWAKGVSVLKVYPLPPFATNHVDLVNDIVTGKIIPSVGVQVNNAFIPPSLTIGSSSSQCLNDWSCNGPAGTSFVMSGDGFSTSQMNTNYEQYDTGQVVPLSGFSASNGSIPQNSWQDITNCSTPLKTAVFFAQKSTTNQSSNAVTEQVIAGSCAPAAAIAVSPLTAQVTIGGHQAFTATVTGLSNTAVTWSVNGSIGGDTTVGTISTTGSDTALYTAPATVPSPTTVTVTATSQADASVSGSASVTIEPSGAVTVSPASVALAEDGTQQFTATVSGGGTVNWTVTGGTANGTITSAGLYTAPNTTGTFYVVATNAADTSQSFTATVTVSATAGQWTWMSGSTNLGGPIYGTQGVPSATNSPGNRIDAVSWTDANDHFWLYGGGGNQTYFSDLWEYDPTLGTWTWVNGSNLQGQPAVYGTEGIPSVTNTPGELRHAVSWMGSDQNLWLFGGSKGPFDYLSPGSNFNSLWKFDPTAGTWTWMSGSNSTDAPGVYGVQGIPATSNVPGARIDSVSWTDANGNLWLFGGAGYDSSGNGGELNDLWKFDPSAETWTWVSGSSIANALPVYGTQGVAASSNVPGARSAATGWIDSNGRLWLFGGNGYDSSGNAGLLNDLWVFDPSAGTWTWVSGSSIANALPVYGTQGLPAASNVPGAREYAISWIDSNGNAWLFGGYGDNLVDQYGIDMNDFWRFDSTTGIWTWFGGTSTLGVYGTQGVPAASNLPALRCCGVAWTDTDGDLWLFSGGNTSENLSDIWRYQP